MTTRPDTRSAEKALAATLGVLGFAASVVAIGMAFAMAGVGHGWVSPFLISFLALIPHPLAGIAYAWGRRRWAWILALTLLVLGLAADFAIYFRTRSEGLRYVEKVWIMAPSLVLIWAVAWSYGQVLAAAALFVRTFRLISKEPQLSFLAAAPVSLQRAAFPCNQPLHCKAWPAASGRLSREAKAALVRLSGH